MQMSEAAAAAYVVGIDVSDWQGDINWDLAKIKIQFAILRASHGKNADAHFSRNVSECNRLNIPWGAYHYATPGPASSWEVQADFFLSIVKETPPLWCWLDAEDSGLLDKTALNSWYAKWIKHVQTNGLTVGIYTSPGFWNAHLPITGWAKTLPLWVAHWTTAPKPILPLDWTPPANPTAYPWVFWQHEVYKGKGPEYGMESADLDMDRFNGNEQVFNQQFGTHIVPFPTPEPPPPPPSVGEYQVIANSWANLRSSAENLGAANDIGNLVKGSTFKPVGASGDWYEIHGYVAKSTVKKVG